MINKRNSEAQTDASTTPTTPTTPTTDPAVLLALGQIASQLGSLATAQTLTANDISALSSRLGQVEKRLTDYQESIAHDGGIGTYAAARVRESTEAVQALVGQVNNLDGAVKDIRSWVASLSSDQAAIREMVQANSANGNVVAIISAEVKNAVKAELANTHQLISQAASAVREEGRQTRDAVRAGAA